jgi:ABC-2 type transport system ATP-binding protein
VFLDEPTDGVDPVGRAAIRDVIQRLKDDGVTVFINSHLLMEVELMCDRIVVLDRGNILREGTVDELTPNTGLVRFHLGATNADLVALVRPHVESATFEKGALACRMAPERTDAVIDTLRAAGVSIRAVQPERLTLEASFIDMIVAQSRGGAA